jgi:type I restriction enzyme S subunit
MMKRWEIKKLGDVCELYQPKTISSKDMVEDGEFSVFGANGIIGKYDKYNHEEPQLLITCRGATCGTVNISEPKSWINGNAMVVRPYNKTLDLKYVEYLFRGVIDISKIITGAAQPQITRQSLSPVLIPTPTLPEQQRIVSILDEAFAAIDKAKANAEKNLKNAKELFESYLQGVFENKGDDWEEKSIGDVCDFENGDRGKNYPNKSHRVEFGIPFINAGHLNDNEIDYKEMDYISEQRFNMLGNGKIKPNDLLFCLRGSLGKVANVGKLDKGAIASSLVILRVKKQLNNDYFLYFLNSKLTINQILDFGNGAAQPNLSAGSLKKFKIPIPPSISIQEKIVQQLKSLSTETKRLESIHNQKISDLEELKKSILQKAFNGELNTADICA